VKVTFRVAPDAPEQTVEGHVVRIGGDAESSTWPHRIAIEFDQEHPELEGQLKRSDLPPAAPA
jgi:hypothetical protein